MDQDHLDLLNNNPVVSHASCEGLGDKELLVMEEKQRLSSRLQNNRNSSIVRIIVCRVLKNTSSSHF